MTDCNFRRIPQARHDEDEMSGEVWYSVDRLDVFPEQFGPFLLGDPRIRAAMLRHHADLFTYAFWQARKERIQAGLMEDVFAYPQEVRFERRFSAWRGAAPAATGAPAAPVTSSA